MKKLIVAAFAAVCALANAWAYECELPSGYRAVEWIQSDGGQLIDTGVQPGVTLSAEMHFGNVVFAGSKALFGQGWGQYYYLLCTKGTDDAPYFHFYGGGTQLIGITADTDYFLTIATDGTLKIGVEGGVTNTYSGLSLSSAASKNLALFGHFGNANERAKFRLYSFKLWNNGAPIRNFVPCRETAGDERIGLYDTVGNAFYANTGTGVFTCGADRAASDLLNVTGTPEEFATPDPSYGKNTGFEAGATTNATVPAVWTNATKTLEATCTGWKLYDETASLVGEGSGHVCAYTHPTPAAYRRLTWQWSTKNLPMTFTWTGAGADNLASNGANWDRGFAPAAAAIIVLDGTSVKDLTWDLTVPLTSWTQTEAYTGVVTLNTVSTDGGYNALVVSGDVDLQGGRWTCPGPGQTGKQIISAVVGGDFTVGTNAIIKAMGKTWCTYRTGQSSDQVGASHGGRGALRKNKSLTISDCYGSIYDPYENGSYYAGDSRGGAGGIIKLVIGGELAVEGLIAASAWDSCYQAGSGGSVNITAGSISGTGGWKNGRGGIYAEGSCKWYDDNGHGGGGRIALTLTNANATVANYTGHLTARALTNGSGGQLEEANFPDSFFKGPSSSYNTRAGAGTVYIREKNAAVDAGTLIIDQDRTDGKVTDEAWTVLESSMSADERAFGKIVIRKGAKFQLDAGLEVEASAVEKDASTGTAFVMEEGSVLKLVGDADGNAYLNGDLELKTLTVDSSVRKLIVTAGSTISIATSIKACGTAGRLLQLVSDTPGTAFNLNVSSAAVTELEYLDIADCTASGMALVANNSQGSNVSGWTFVSIVPGATITWTGASSTGWGDGGNWDLGRAPAKTDLVVIPTGCSAYPMLPLADTVISNLTVEAGASLTLNGFALTVTGNATVNGSFAATASEVVTIAGSCSFGSAAVISPASSTFVFSGAGSATVNLADKTFFNLAFDRTATVTGGANAFETRVEAGSVLAFEAGKTLKTTILTVNGTSDDDVTLSSATPGTSWSLAVAGHAAVTDVRVTDSDASTGAKVFAGGASSGSNCINWSFEDTRYSWTGMTSDDFAAAGNWLVNGAVPAAGPGADDYIVIDAASASRTPVVKTPQTVAALTVVSGGLRVNAALAVAGSLTVMDGATLTDDKPISVGGDCSFLSGATLTHTALPSTDNKSGESYRCDLTVGGDMTVQKGAFVNLRSKGYQAAKGPVTVYDGWWYGCHGGGCAKFNGVNVQQIYGSIFAPTNSGTGGNDRGGAVGNAVVGGGAIVLNVTGKLTLDGNLEARPYGYQDYFAGAGGSVFITAGELAGGGNISAQGGWVTTGSAGGGGRVSVVLTKAGADWTGYMGKMAAYGGSKGSASSEIDANTTDAANGTVYTKAADETLGTIFFENQETTSTAAFTDLGYDAASSDLKSASLKLGRNARVRIVSDVTVGDIESIDATAKLFLNGHTLKVNRFKNKEINALIGTRIVLDGGKLEWKVPGLAVIVR